MKFTIEKAILIDLVKAHVSSLISINPSATLTISFDDDSVVVAIGSDGSISDGQDKVEPATPQTEEEPRKKRAYTRRNVEVQEKPSPEKEPEPEQNELPFDPNEESPVTDDEQPEGEELSEEYKEEKTLVASEEEVPPAAPKKGLFSGLKKPVNN